MLDSIDIADKAEIGLRKLRFQGPIPRLAFHFLRQFYAKKEKID